MVRRFPYTLKVFQQTESVYDEATGNFSPGSSEWVEVSKCRDENNSGGQKITTEDGEVYVYGAVIYLPKEAPEVLKGQKIQVVYESGNVRFSGNSTLFKREQLHSRLWV